MSNIATGGASGFSVPNFTNVANGVHTPRVQEWDLQMQHSFGPKTLLTLKYVGNHAVKLLRGFDYNQIDVKANDLQTFTFAQPITVTIDYSRCASGTLLSAPLTVWHIDPSTKELLEDMHGVDDKVTHRITFTTTHFSGYAVAN